jgi:serine phosphatase RsbU (regulator of sigma subunit)
MTCPFDQVGKSVCQVFQLTSTAFGAIIAAMSSLRADLRLHVVNAVLLLAGLVAVSATMPYFFVQEPLTIAGFVLLGIATNLFVIPRGTSILVLSDAVFLAASIVLGPPATAIVVVASVTAGTINMGLSPQPGRRVSQMLGNLGMYMLMISAATWTYQRAGGRLPIDRLSSANYLACLAFILVYEAVNRLIMYSRQLLRGQSLRQDLLAEREDMPIEVLSLHVGIPIALLYASSGFGPLVILGVFIMFVSVVLRRRVAMLEQLQRQVGQLSALNEIGRAISANLDIPRLMEAIYRESGKVIDTTNFYIALYEAETDEVTFILDTENGKVNTTPTVRRGGQGLTEYVTRSRVPLLLPDNVVERARALGMDPVGKPAQCWLGVPMIAGEDVLGMIAAQSYDTPGAFTREHVDILMTIAAQAAIAVQNVRLLEAVAKQERLRQELALARSIQQSLLPEPPKLPGLFIAARCLSAEETGGDLFDFIPLNEHCLGITIGDVTGKGMPAALLMATVRSALRAHAQFQPDPAKVLRVVNRVMYGDMQGKTNVTLVYGVLDTRAWTLTIANAGHLSPLLCGEDDDPIYLDGLGRLPLGAQADVQYFNRVYTLQPGQTVLLYTDGVVEARNPRAQMLGFEGLQAIVAHQPGERLIDTILERAAQFTGPLALEDDVTLVVIERMR